MDFKSSVEKFSRRFRDDHRFLFLRVADGGDGDAGLAVENLADGEGERGEPDYRQPTWKN